jgi:hypothetical protein
MSTVPSGTRFIGISDRVNLTERKSAGLNADTQPYTIDDLVDTIGVGSQGPQGVEGPAGPPGPVGPAGLEWQGAWVSGTSYVANDAVGYDGASWFCILATSGTTAPDVDTTHWALLASQGAVGPQGAQGPTGAQGAGATQTLQQTVGLGNTITGTVGPTTFTTTLSSTSIKVGASIDSGITLNTTQIICEKSGGTELMSLQFPPSLSGIKQITLPNATGTVALTSDFTKTSGAINLNGTFQVLPYDINSCASTGGKAYLPTTTEIGKQVITIAVSNNIEIRANSAGTNFMFKQYGIFLQSVTLTTNQTYRFTFLGFGGYWLVEQIN